MSIREYGLYGPYTIPRDTHGRVAKDDLRGFWEVAETSAEGLARASGCYIFSIRAGKGARPWYVGQAKKTFKQECFAHHKLVLYNGVLAGREKGTPILFLLARKTPGGRFQKKLTDREAGRLENLLIDHCLQANDDLFNKQGTALLREARIPSLLNSSKGSHSSQEAKFLRRLLNLK